VKKKEKAGQCDASTVYAVTHCVECVEKKNENPRFQLPKGKRSAMDAAWSGSHSSLHSGGREKKTLTSIPEGRKRVLCDF